MSENAGGRPTLYTVGHSNHELPAFVALLTRSGVTAIADVRSQPYSRFTEQFNRETLAEALKRAGIQYVFMGKELGARRTERDSYRDNRARYDLIAKLPAFREGLERVRQGMLNFKVALMCAEKDPITCHRTILVCRNLRALPIEIRHILEDGTMESTEQAETRLLKEVGLPEQHLFHDRSELVEQAYDKQGERIAFLEAEGPGSNTDGSVPP